MVQEDLEFLGGPNGVNIDVVLLAMHVMEEPGSVR